MHFALTSVAVHLSWVSADLYVVQILIGVTAMTKVCCQAVLHSSTEQWRMHFALTSVAVNQCWVAAELYVEQILIGVTAVTQACCQDVLHSSTEQWRMHFALTSVAVNCSVLLCKKGSQQACANAITPMKVCSSYSSALTQH